MQTLVLENHTYDLLSQHGLMKIFDCGEEIPLDDIEAINNALHRTLEKKACADCTESIKVRGMVCDRHYHDYVECYEPDCLGCLILERNPNYTAKDKE